MKKLLLIISLLFAVILGFKGGQAVFASNPNQGFINIYGTGPIDPPCTSNCGSLHPFAKNCDPNTMTCDGSNSKDMPGTKRWVMKWKCNGKNANCADSLAGGPVQGPLKIDSNLACGISEQIDVYDKNCLASGTWDNTCNTVDYITYYSGDCPASTPQPSSAPSSTPAPSVTPAPSSAPGCGIPCTGQAANFCQGAPNGCTTCDANSGMCINPNNPNSNPGTSPSPSNPPVSQAPQPSPSPAFTPDMCSCDGMDNTPIFSGSSVTFTAYGKVSTANGANAYVKDASFTFAKGNELTTSPISRSNPIPAVLDTSNTDNSKVRYKIPWTITLPAQLDPNATYGVWAQLTCAQKGMAYNTQAISQDRVVLGTSTHANQPVGLLDRILNFFAGLFGQQPQQPAQKVAPTSAATPTQPRQGIQSAPGSNSQLQIGSTQPGEVVERKACLIKFKVKQ